MNEANQITIKAFLISFIIHALCLCIFIFTFTARPAPHKPFIIFLGSILRGHDLSILERELTQHSSKSIRGAPNDRALFREANQIYQLPLTDKPFYPTSIPVQQKRIFKTLTKEPEVETLTEDSDVNLGIEQSMPPRQPLKLNP